MRPQSRGERRKEKQKYSSFVARFFVSCLVAYNRFYRAPTRTELWREQRGERWKEGSTQWHFGRYCRSIYVHKQMSTPRRPAAIRSLSSKLTARSSRRASCRAEFFASVHSLARPSIRYGFLSAFRHCRIFIHISETHEKYNHIFVFISPPPSSSSFVASTIFIYFVFVRVFLLISLLLISFERHLRNGLAFPRNVNWNAAPRSEKRFAAERTSPLLLVSAGLRPFQAYNHRRRVFFCRKSSFAKPSVAANSALSEIRLTNGNGTVLKRWITRRERFAHWIIRFNETLA